MSLQLCRELGKPLQQVSATEDRSLTLPAEDDRAKEEILEEG